MDKYTPITTRAELVEALSRGLDLQLNFKGNSSASDYQRHEPGQNNGWVGAPQDSARRDSADERAFATRSFNWRAVGEHDLSAPAKSAPLTNADLNPGDIVHGYGKEWRVQGIDDNAPDAGLLLLDTAEPEDADDFVEATFGVTRGIDRRPLGGTLRRWRWGGAGEVELVSRGEPKPVEPEEVDPFASLPDDFTGFDTPPAFRVSITLEADSAEGLQAAIDAITGLQS